MKYVKFCPYCSRIEWPAYTDEEYSSHKSNYSKQSDPYNIEGRILQDIAAYNNNLCASCGAELQDTKITLEEYYSKIKYDLSIDTEYREIEDWDEYIKINLKILKEYIEPLGKSNKNSTEYISNMLEFYEIDLGPKQAHTPTPSSIIMAQQMAQNRPKCPICGSTNLKKLTALDRGLSTFMWGLGSNKIGKTYQCNSCKSTF